MPIVTLAKDQLSAELTLLPGEVLSADAARAFLQGKQVVAGLDEAELAALPTGPDPAPYTLTVARGVPAQPGTDGRIEFLVRMGQGDMAPHVDDDGRVDYLNLDLAVSVPIGTPIARIHPPCEGVEGQSVTGKALKPPRPREAKFKLGEGVELAPDGQTVVSTRAGNPAFSGVTISVNHELTLSQGVGLHTGHIQFDGDVTIRGDVGLQMEVRATGSIVVEGIVEGARLIAEGNVTVKGGLRHHAALTAGGNAVIQYAENATLTVGADLLVHGHLVQCETSVRGHATLNGALMGGVLRATAIDARTLGTPRGTATKVVAACPPPSSPELFELAERQAAVQENLAQLAPRADEALALLAHAEGGPRAELLKQVVAAAAQQRELLAAIEAESHALRAALPRPPVYVSAREGICPGVALLIDGQRLEVDAPHPPGKLMEAQGVLQLLPLGGPRRTPAGGA